MMNASLKEIYVLKFNRVLTMQKSMVALWNHLCVFLVSAVLTNSLAFCRPDFEAGLRDFKTRLANYEKVVHRKPSKCLFYMSFGLLKWLVSYKYIQFLL